jgi:hypothetical protein
LLIFTYIHQPFFRIEPTILKNFTMGFSQKIKEDILVASARHCCVCHKYKGVKIEVHHIIPKEKGGKDTSGNAISLCFDCHSDAGHYNSKHPKGTKLSPAELRKHKRNWFLNVKNNNILDPSNMQVELDVNEENFDYSFRPIFIIQTNIYKDINELKTKNYKEIVEQLKTGNLEEDLFLNKINSFDDFVNYANGDFFEKFFKYDPKKENNPQPVLFSTRNMNLGYIKYKNLSVCLINLKLTNHGPDVLEDYKVYLNFENILNAECVDKRIELLEINKYKYTVHFKDKYNAEFIPERPILVQNDSIEFDKICFKTINQQILVSINWKIVARNFNQTGIINLNIFPINEVQEIIKYVDNPGNFKSSEKVKSKFI